MRVIIAGGRKLPPDIRWSAWISYVDSQIGITEVVSGAASGADQIGEAWAAASGVPVTRFPAAWTEYGLQAGFMRNQEMAVYGDALIALPGGRGTRHMVRAAYDRGLWLWVYPAAGIDEGLTYRCRKRDAAERLAAARLPTSRPR